MENQPSVAGILFFLFIELGIFVLVFAGLWKLFVKAGKPGWAAIVPIYNIIVMQEIVGREAWKIILLFIPLVNIYFGITLNVSFAKAYGKYGIGNYLAVIFLGIIFLPLWGFSDDVQYVGPVEGPNQNLAPATSY
jgi:signal peptidase I